MLESMAGERLLARRVKELREARGWTQAQLAEAMAVVGCPLHQTAISRIEKPSAKDGRRAITLDEALAFSRVFDLPLHRLVTPAEPTRTVPDLLEQLKSASDHLRVALREVHAADAEAARAAEAHHASQRAAQAARVRRSGYMDLIRTHAGALAELMNADESIRATVRADHPEMYDLMVEAMGRRITAAPPHHR